MSNVITVENLSKKYIISHQQREDHSSLREMISNRLNVYGSRLMHPFRCLTTDSHPSQSDIEDFWALKNVFFEVKPGERIGIIGKNGAGKSTLLKILSRITEPTTGSIRIKGRVASLLEVGTGFHPELTGRENIYLNGAILGMGRQEIRKKFDEIVGFSEIEKFLDTPVKRYSSGMYVRLAFAVAAHLEPEILVVDEVLAVGDAQFQKKCMGKMEDVGREGRTIIFVSHNMGAISRLCSQCIWLADGNVKRFGDSISVINNYIHDGASNKSTIAWELDDAPGDDNIKLTKVTIGQQFGEQTSSMVISKPITIEIELLVVSEIPELSVGIRVSTLDGQVILHSANVVTGKCFVPKKGVWHISCFLPSNLFNVGTYALTVGADIPYQKIIFMEENILTWKVEATSKGMGRYNPDTWKGIIGPSIGEWSETQLF